MEIKMKIQKIFNNAANTGVMLTASLFLLSLLRLATIRDMEKTIPANVKNSKEYHARYTKYVGQQTDNFIGSLRMTFCLTAAAGIGSGICALASRGKKKQPKV